MCDNGLRDAEGLQHNKEIAINLYHMEVRDEMIEKGKNTFLFICYCAGPGICQNLQLHSRPSGPDENFRN